MVNHKRTIQKIKAESGNITFHEVSSLLNYLGYRCVNKGKTSGSRIKFMKDSKPIYLHKPYPRNTLLFYQIKELKNTLKGEI